MPDPAFLAAPGTVGERTNVTAACHPVQRACHYQVREMPWGNRRRLAVRDTAADTTIAIRTTRQIADSDLLRLNWGARGPPGPWDPSASCTERFAI